MLIVILKPDEKLELALANLSLPAVLKPFRFYETQWDLRVAECFLLS